MLTGRIHFPAQTGKQRIIAKLLVIVQIFITKTDAHHPLTYQREHRMLYVIGMTIVDKTVGKVAQIPSSGINLAQQ